MAFYSVDLTTRAGAETAAHKGGVAAFVFAGMCVLGMLLFGYTAGFGTPAGIGAMAGAALEGIVALIAGFRLRAGKGVFVGTLLALLIVIEMAMKVASLAIGGLILPGILLVVVVNGLRGAWVLGHEHRFADDASEVFY